MATLFISDLHLEAERPDIAKQFLTFMEQDAREAEELYILGDLFEAWVGDDDDAPMNRTVCRALRACAESGTTVYVMHGNRDFLLGPVFAEQSGATLLDDPERIDLYGTPTLLMHGDLLCTDDTEYLTFRKMVRDPDWQSAMLAKPLEERRLMAQEMRASSREQTGGKPETIMDVNSDAVIDVMRAHQVTRLIHGHTHRPAEHELEVAGEVSQRIVLGDWYEQGSMLVCSPSGCELQALPL